MSEDASNPTPHWGFWGTLAWAAVVGALFVAVQLFTLGVFAGLVEPASDAGRRLLAAPHENGSLLAFSTVAAALACCPAIALIVKMKRGASIHDSLALRPVPRADLLRWFGWFAVVLIATEAVRLALGRPLVPEFMTQSYVTADPLWLFWIALIVAAPLFEETFFRGFLFRGLEESAIGTRGTIFLTALLWTVIHTQYDAVDMSVVFALGLLLGAARAATQSLYMPLALHAAANLIATVETAIVAR